MRRNMNNRRNRAKKERMIMIASSTFVLAALTMTGLYMKDRTVEQQDDGYTVDFTAMENTVEEKMQEIAFENDFTAEENMTAKNQPMANAPEEEIILGNPDDDLDYMPLEAGSHLVEIPGLTDSVGDDQLEEVDLGDDLTADAYVAEQAEVSEESDTEQTDAEEAAAEEVANGARELQFNETSNLIRPVSSEVLIPYSMDKSVYFATLDQYRYNPAIIFQAAEDTVVAACADCKVVDIYEDAQIGRAVKLDLGNGYEVIYGQLKEIWVVEEGYINAGEALGSVAAPTKYYSVEGSNLYFSVTKDGVAINPEDLF